MHDYSGQQFGNYTLLRILGQGGQASVYLGQHVQLEKKLAAVKILHANLIQESIHEFRDEANIIAGLRHPHIITVLDFDVREGVPFLVMDYYPEGTLHSRHAGKDPLPLPLVVSYVKQVGSALQYAHDRKLLHRDIKPSNMLVDEGGQIVLSDFGIAVAAHSTSSLRTQSFAGTAPYMAPEQIQQYPRKESDQYALGIVVYRWLAGELPFSGTAQEVAMKHLVVPPASLVQRIPGLSKDVERVVFKSLAKEPKERFPSVRAFVEAFEEAAQGRLHSDLLLAGPVTQDDSLSVPPSLESHQTALPQYQASPAQQVYPQNQRENVLLPQASPYRPPVAPLAPGQLPSPYPFQPHAPQGGIQIPTPLEFQKQPPNHASTGYAGGNQKQVQAMVQPVGQSLSARSRITRPMDEGEEAEAGGLINGTNVLRMVGQNRSLASWRIVNPVFHHKFQLGLWLLLMVGGWMFSYLLVHVIGLIMHPNNYQPNQPINLILTLILTFIVAGIANVWIRNIVRKRVESSVLVLLPNGCVYGHLALHVMPQVINYNQVTWLGSSPGWMHAQIMNQKGVAGKVSLSLQYFQHPQAIANTIQQSYADFLASRS